MKSIGTVFALAFTVAACSKADKPTSTPEPAVDSTESAAADEPAAQQTVVDIAVGNPDFSTLVTALQAADLVEALQAEGPFTVFAPTNAAFAKLPDGALQGLLDNPEQLAAVLKHHVVSGAVSSGDVVSMSSAESIGGTMLAIDATDGVKVGGATVIQADIEASNGVIHVIDTVMLP